MEALSLLYDICVCQLPKFNKNPFEVFPLVDREKTFKMMPTMKKADYIDESHVLFNVL